MLFLHSLNSYKWTEYIDYPGIYHMMRKNVTSGETFDFGKIPKDCLSLLDYAAYNAKPTSTLTDVDIAEDEKDEDDGEIKSIGSDGENESSDSSSDSSSDFTSDSDTSSVESDGINIIV